MDTLAIGPLVIAAGRLYAAIALAFLVIAAGRLGRRRRIKLEGWAWTVAVAALLVGRAVFVLRHLPAFTPEPWTIIAVWQGGFDPWGAALGALGLTLLRYRRSMRELGPALGLLVAAGLLLAGLHAIPLGGDLRGRPLPDLTLDELNTHGGVAAKSITEFQGAPLVVNLWATWCPPCRRELPLLAETAARDTAAIVLMVNQGEPAGHVSAFLAQRNLSFPHVLLDPDGELAAAFEAKGYPTTLVFDPGGRLVTARMGEVSRAWLQDALNEAGANGP